MASEKPVATNIVATEDVPVCPDCGHREWLNRFCLYCPTGVMPDETGTPAGTE